jgi:hypothetical protein
VITPESATASSIEALAAAWLNAERESVASAGEASYLRRALEASAAYDDAIRSATQEELLLAYEAARRVQAAEEVGSGGWAEARAVSQLLRHEYEAAPRL